MTINEFWDYVDKHDMQFHDLWAAFNCYMDEQLPEDIDGPYIDHWGEFIEEMTYYDDPDLIGMLGVMFSEIDGVKYQVSFDVVGLRLVGFVNKRLVKEEAYSDLDHLISDVWDGDWTEYLNWIKE